MDKLKNELAKLQTEIDELESSVNDESRSFTKDELEKVTEKLDRIETIEAEIKTRSRISERKPEEKPIARAILDNVEPAAEKEEYRFGQYVQDCIKASRPDGGDFTPRLRNHQKRALSEINEQRAISGLSELIPSDGGFLLTTDYSSELLQNAYATGLLASRCRRIPISTSAGKIVIPGVDETSRADGYRNGGVRMYWAGEGDEKTSSKPKFRRVELEPHKLVGLVYMTDELMMDVAALEGYVRDMFAQEMGFKLDDAIIEGTGAGQPLGIKNSGALVSVAKEVGQAADSIVAENIEKMYSRIFPSSLSNSVWLINQNCWPQIFQLHHAVGTGGAPMFMLPGSMPNAPAGTLLGRPIIPIEQCETLGDAGDIYFVDFKHYMLTDKGGMQSALSMHVRFIYDETVLRFVYRVDGQPDINSAVTPFKTTDTQSPFITLAERA